MGQVWFIFEVVHQLFDHITIDETGKNTIRHIFHLTYRMRHPSNCRPLTAGACPSFHKCDIGETFRTDIGTYLATVDASLWEKKIKKGHSKSVAERSKAMI